jgi:hypothetical protein
VTADLQRRFAETGCNIQKLLVEIALIAANATPDSEKP